MEPYDIAVMYLNDNVVFEPVDIFTCGLGLYTVMLRDGDALLAELANLDGLKLGKGLEDYCFIASQDALAMLKANKRLNENEVAGEAFTAVFLKDMRTVKDIEEEIGGSVLCAEFQHKLFYHVQKYL